MMHKTPKQNTLTGPKNFFGPKKNKHYLFRGISHFLG